MKIRKKEILPILIIFYLILSEIFMFDITFLKYSDEIVAMLSFIYVLFYFIKNKIEIKDYRTKTLLCCICVTIIGILSNMISKVQDNNIAIMLDVVGNFKITITALAFSLMINKDISIDISKKLNNISKFFIISGFICGIISIFFNIGMRGQMRFGRYGFNFIFKYAHVFAIFLYIALLIIAINTKKRKKLYIYSIMVIVQLILTTKGTSFVGAASILILLWYFRIKERKNKNGKINISIIILMGIFSIILGRYQIESYFMNDNAPRAILLKEGINIAKEYFPIGAGFATFGSDMAAKYYSNIYYDLGFYNYYGMNPEDTSFLNDNYWPMIIAQFGIIGFLLVAYIIYILFKYIQKVNLKNYYCIKCILMASYIYLIVASLGTSIFTTSVTTILIIVMIISLKIVKEEKNEKEKF